MLSELTKKLDRCHSSIGRISSNHGSNGIVVWRVCIQHLLGNLEITPIFTTKCSNLIDKSHKPIKALLDSFIIKHDKTLKLLSDHINLPFFDHVGSFM